MCARLMQKSEKEM